MRVHVHLLQSGISLCFDICNLSLAWASTAAIDHQLVLQQQQLLLSSDEMRLLRTNKLLLPKTHQQKASRCTGTHRSAGTVAGPGCWTFNVPLLGFGSSRRMSSSCPAATHLLLLGTKLRVPFWQLLARRPCSLHARAATPPAEHAQA